MSGWPVRAATLVALLSAALSVGYATAYNEGGRRVYTPAGIFNPASSNAAGARILPNFEQIHDRFERRGERRGALERARAEIDATFVHCVHAAECRALKVGNDALRACRDPRFFCRSCRRAAGARDHSPAPSHGGAGAAGAAAVAGARRHAHRPAGPAHRADQPGELLLHDGAGPQQLDHLRPAAAAALLSISLAFGCGDGATGPDPFDALESFDRFWLAFDENYSYFEYKRIDWDSLGDAWRPRARELDSPFTRVGNFDFGRSGLQFQTDTIWFEDLGVSYHVGLQDFTLWLVGLTVLGIAVPMASAVADVAAARRDYLDESGGRYVHVIADGSIGRSGDVSRAIVNHLDTIGAAVSELKPNGRLGITPVGMATTAGQAGVPSYLADRRADLFGPGENGDPRRTPA